MYLHRVAEPERLSGSVILDGEMLVWDPTLEKYLAFGTLKTAALGMDDLEIETLAEHPERSGDENAPRPCCKSANPAWSGAAHPAVKLFDILYLNDHVLTGKRVSERKRLLKSGKVFKELDDYKGRLEFAEEKTGKSGKDIRDMLERILETKLASHSLYIRKL